MITREHILGPSQLLSRIVSAYRVRLAVTLLRDQGNRKGIFKLLKWLQVGDIRFRSDIWWQFLIGMAIS